MSSQSPNSGFLSPHRMYVIGTAGHVDHGKSTLVTALTGIDPDRLAEEKAREMTIDLGFAWMSLADGESVGIVDVPGHRDFIENMLAGVAGMDAVLLVIAADEGVMPQTREHLHILDLLDIKHGIIVLTKTDVVDDADWLVLVQADIRAAVAGTTLADASILPVSARTGSGLAELKQALAALLSGLPPRKDLGRPRLPIDRTFTITGFGTVLTGTLSGGSLRISDEVELQPSGLRGRIRGLQSYQKAVQTAYPGSRVAVNIVGIDKTDVQRGDVLALPGQIQPTQMIDVWFRHLPDASRPLKHDAEVKLFVGAAETSARVRLLGTDSISPGETGWLQLRLMNPSALTDGDRYILRYPSPGETIGGGIVVDAHPPERWKRFAPAVIEHLTIRAQGTPAERLAQAADSPDPLPRPVLQRQLGMDDNTFVAALEEAVQFGFVRQLPDQSLITEERWQTIAQAIGDHVRAYHQAFPLRMGMPREELRSRLGIKQASLAAILNTLSDVIHNHEVIAYVDHQVVFTSAQTAQIDNLLHTLGETPYTPPAFRAVSSGIEEEAIRALFDRGDLVPVQPDMVYTRAAYDLLVEVVLTFLDSHDSISASQLRDHIGTSRKYAIALLEFLDSQGITKRIGDLRVRGPKSAH
ncbi:MAG: selenocysteine-specific translation elongation factor [Anaerolineae bacterium]